MNNFITEKIKVIEMIKRMHPSAEINYDGMLKVLQRVNPAINMYNISEIHKRVMCLQLISHSISKSCSIIKKMTFDTKTINEISDFQMKINDFSSGFVTKQDVVNKSVLEEKQIVASVMFLERWSEITHVFPLNFNLDSFHFVQ